MSTTTVTTTPKALAEELGTTPKKLRAFMRRLADSAMAQGNDPILERVGQGNRYGLTAKQAKAIKAAWTKAHKASSDNVADSEAPATDA